MKQQPARVRGRIISALTVLILLAVAAGLYMQIILKEEPPIRIDTLTPQASVQVLEEDEVPTVETPAQPQPLAEDQMAVIMQVFAPEPETN